MIKKSLQPIKLDWINNLYVIKADLGKEKTNIILFVL